MSFQSPLLLMALLVVPLAAIAYRAHARRAERAVGAFAGAALLPSVAPRRPGLAPPRAVCALRAGARRAGPGRRAPGDHGGGPGRAGVDRPRDGHLGLDAGHGRAALAARRGARGRPRASSTTCPREVRVGGWSSTTRSARWSRPRTTAPPCARSSSGCAERRHSDRRGARRRARPGAGQRTRGRGAGRDRAALGRRVDAGASRCRWRTRPRARIPIYTVALGTDAGTIEVETPGGNARAPSRPTARRCAGSPPGPAGATSRPTTGPS